MCVTRYIGAGLFDKKSEGYYIQLILPSMDSAECSNAAPLNNKQGVTAMLRDAVLVIL